MRLLHAVGVSDPFKLEGDAAEGAHVLTALLPIVLLWPFALIGTALGWLPYRLIRPLSVAMARGETDIISTIKLLLGLVVMTSVYLGEAALAALIGGPLLGAAVLLLAPLCGFVAVRFDERVQLRKELLRAFWLRATHARIGDAIREQRTRLCKLIEDALGRQGSGPALESRPG